MRAPSAPIATTPWLEDAPTTPLSDGALFGEDPNGGSAEHEVAQRRSKLTYMQATTMAQPREPPWHELVLEVERILMVDLAATQVQAKGVAPTTRKLVYCHGEIWLQ
jgi:hypothetical protein